MIALPPEEIQSRVKRIKLVLSDNDGVFTDNGVYYSERGEEFKRYSVRDGMGVERLRSFGMETGIITGEISPNLKKRAEKLKITRLYLGVSNKLEKLEDVLAETGLQLGELAYIGDDVNDLEIIREISAFGVTACPGDALYFVEPHVHYHCKASGGRGAFREFAEWLIRMRSI